MPASLLSDCSSIPLDIACQAAHNVFQEAAHTASAVVKQVDDLDACFPACAALQAGRTLSSLRSWRDLYGPRTVLVMLLCAALALLPLALKHVDIRRVSRLVFATLHRRPLCREKGERYGIFIPLSWMAS